MAGKQRGAMTDKGRILNDGAEASFLHFTDGLQRRKDDVSGPLVAAALHSTDDLLWSGETEGYRTESHHRTMRAQNLCPFLGTS